MKSKINTKLLVIRTGSFLQVKEFNQLLKKIVAKNLTNKMNGHRVRGMEVGKLAELFGSILMSIAEVKIDKVILAVKIYRLLTLEISETYHYPFIIRINLILNLDC